MIFRILWNTAEVAVFNDENESKPGYQKNSLGVCVIDLDPMHLSRDLRWLAKKLTRLGAAPSKEFLDRVAHCLRAKEHISKDLFISLSR